MSMLKLLIVALLGGSAFGAETSTTEAPPERSARLDDGGRGMMKKPNYLPYRHAASGVMKKSGTNVNWSVWKGDEGDDISDDAEDKWPAAAPWAADPWAVDPTYLMALKNAMVDIKADAKPGFLAKLGSDPALLLIAASIPISLLLAAVLPTLMNMLMNGSNMPLISTTATGGASRGVHVDEIDILPYLTPVMEAIGAFGVRSIANPQCTQRILCQVAEDRISANKAFYLKKALKIARVVSDGSWLESFGVKELVDSLGEGRCEDIPCASKDTTKSRFSRKLADDENTP